MTGWACKDVSTRTASDVHNALPPLQIGEYVGRVVGPEVHGEYVASIDWDGR
jgi:hypothetical protein